LQNWLNVSKPVSALALAFQKNKLECLFHSSKKKPAWMKHLANVMTGCKFLTETNTLTYSYWTSITSTKKKKFYDVFYRSKRQNDFGRRDITSLSSRRRLRRLAKVTTTPMAERVERVGVDSNPEPLANGDGVTKARVAVWEFSRREEFPTKSRRSTSTFRSVTHSTDSKSLSRRLLYCPKTLYIA